MHLEGHVGNRLGSPLGEYTEQKNFCNEAENVAANPNDHRSALKYNFVSQWMVNINEIMVNEVTMTPLLSDTLLRSSRFVPLFITQFLGALNGNLVKTAMLFLLVFAGQKDASNPAMVSIAAAVFVLPMIIFSAYAGALADMRDKAALTRAIKLAEIVFVAIVALATATHSTTAMLMSLFLLGTVSAFFGPIKYAIIPQHVRSDEVVSATGIIEAGTFVAILLGQIVGGLLSPSMASMLAIVVAIAALAMSFALAWFVWAVSTHSPHEGIQDVTAFFAGSGSMVMLIALAAVATAGGVFIVPLYAMLQTLGDPARRSRDVAANNILNAIFMVAGSGVAAALAYARFSSIQALGIVAVANLMVGLALAMLNSNMRFRRIRPLA
ncbi:MAG: MFS transporter [Novosphingobium sp.]